MDDKIGGTMAELYGSVAIPVPEQATNVAHEPPGYSPSWDTVRINKCENGFVVTVGCKTFVFMDWMTAQVALSEYWADPVAARKKYCKEG